VLHLLRLLALSRLSIETNSEYSLENRDKCFDGAAEQAQNAILLN
jgi:hypothetical protein